MLSAYHLHYTYPEAGQLHSVLHDVSLELKHGEQVALVGSSGSGKSTLLNLLGGLDQPAAGQIFLNGQELTALKEPALTVLRRQQIGFIYQQFNLIPTLTVAENIVLPLSLLSIPAAQQQERLAFWLNAIHLPTRAKVFPDQLSGGEQQRVAIARALIHQPALVLADEPTGNLDAKTGQLILGLLFNLAKQLQQTLLVVTHSKTVAERAERILVLQEGVLQTHPNDLAW